MLGIAGIAGYMYFVRERIITARAHKNNTKNVVNNVRLYGMHISNNVTGLCFEFDIVMIDIKASHQYCCLLLALVTRVCVLLLI